MLTNVALSSRPAGSLYVRANGVSAFGRLGAVLLPSLNKRRDFHYGFWSSYPSEGGKEKIRPRQRTMKPKKLEALNRKSARDKHIDPLPVCKIEKRMASHYQRPRLPDSLGRETAPTGSGSDGKSASAWIGDNIEDVERGALEHLLFGRSDTRVPGPIQAKAAVPPVGTLARSIKGASADFASQHTLPQSSVDPDYVIDPITNRKVLKSSFNAPIGQQNLSPIFDPDLPATAEELGKYRQVKIEPLSSTHRSEMPSRYSAVLESEECLQARSAPSSRTARQTIRHSKYTGVFWHWGDAAEITGEGALSRLVQPRAAATDSDLASALAVEEDEYAMPEDPTLKYNDLDKYKPVMEKGPTPTPEPGSEYEDLDKYKPVIQKTDAEIYDPASQYQDLDKYKPVRYNEPDGKPGGSINNEVYTDLPKYTPVMYNEPDGKPPTHEEPSYDQAELAQYGAFRYNEPDGKPPSVQDLAAGDEELNLYGTAVRYQEPDGKPASVASDRQEYDDLDSYGPVWYLEPDGKCLAESKEPYNADEPRQYSAVRHHEPDGKQSITSTPYTDLGRYGTVRHNEPDGNGPEPPDTVDVYLGEFDRAQRLDQLYPYAEPAADKAEDLDYLRASDVRASAAARAQSAPQNTAYGNQSSGTLPSQNSNPSFPGPGPGDAEGRKSASKAPSLVSTPPGTPLRFGLTGSERMRTIFDPYSRAPQGLETSYAEECAGIPTWPTYVKTYGDPGSAKNASLTLSDSVQQSPVTPATSASTAQQTLYKILAYDPMTQKINQVDVTTTVHDGLDALAPVEALLSLSKPFKFFPHLAQLETEGFEILCGKGDILIFRKARDAATPEVEAKSDLDASNTIISTSVNPIDMTGARIWEPASANFASPTGYVRYEPEPLDDSRPPPPRFEVPRRKYFRGKTSSPSSHGGDGAEEGPRPARLAKRMVVGATWVAGVSYGLGVVGEYFRSGGADGEGPTRF